MNAIIYLIVGIVNGLFSSGAGQILVFYLIYILKQDTIKSREFSLIIMPIISIVTFALYYLKSNVNNLQLIIFVIISIVLGFLGSKIMNKINSNILNLLSGILLVTITAFSLWRIK